MKTIWKAALLAGAAWSMAGAAYAQDAEEVAAAAAPEASATVEEVVVTARRRAESLQDVPVAVSAFSGEQLEAVGAENITKLQQQTPNLTLQVARGSNSTLIAFIRGVGQQDPLWGFEPGVGLYVDDVYVARPQGAVLDIFDVERVEVLRGPQGTLYGRNTIGGAVKYVTSRIGNEQEVRMRFNAGSFDQKDMIVSAKVPVTDWLSIGGAAARYTRDGYGTNLTTGAEHYNKDVTAARGTIEITPADNLFFRLAYDTVLDKSNAKHGHRETTLVGLFGTPVFTGANAHIGQSPPNVYDTYAGLGDDNRVKTEGWSLTGEWELNDVVTLKSITARRRGRTDTLIDFDNTPSPTLDVPAFYADKQFTQELQLLYEGDRIQGVAGLYYLDTTAAGAFDTIAGNLGLNIVSAGEINTKSVAAFADVSYDVTEALSVSLGGRWTKDEKDGSVYRAFFLGLARSPFNGGVERPPLLVRTDYKPEGSFEKFTPRASVRYEFSPDLTAYASYSQGFKSGGWDMRGDAVATPDTVDGYRPETVDAYEVGLKGVLFDRLSFASAVFQSNYEDQQVTTQVATGSTVASFVDNVGNSKIWGAEFEGNLRILENLSAQMALGYIDAEFEEFIRFNLVTQEYEDIADFVVFQNTPKWTGYLGLNYEQDLGDLGSLRFLPSASYRSEMSMFEYPNPQLDQDSFWLYDASLVWEATDNISLALHGRNLTDEEYRVGGYNFPYGTDVQLGESVWAGNSIIGFYGPPRTVTVSLDVRF
ncbi:MAG TPA: TonB-dependent receptor [Caulobacteraceae bacterium]|nr:TonB-dependent receptor [Caulobacteraceae bacterium]